MIWFFVNIMGAFLWACFALNLINYEPWLVSVAFCILAVNSLLAAMKNLVATS